MKFPNKPKKSLGQNFLIDQNIIQKIIAIGNIKNNKTVLEIGSGYGHLTKKIANLKPKKIYAIEKDKNLAYLLKNDLTESKNIEIINDDIFNFFKRKILKKDVIVFGNLPYNISTKVLTYLVMLEIWPPWYDNLILMFQKEVADRIITTNKSKTFGRLSVLCNWRLEIKKHFDVSENCFFPKPKVKSTVLSFKPKKNYLYKIKNPKNLENVTRILFSNRRKMINKNFIKLFGHKQNYAKDLNVNLNKRPEDLNCETFYKIAMKYEKLFD
tara:strand:+ start:6830 stop:7636 length:807 start_codon:yes stop_codon:yes gene_type:complete